MNDLLASKSFVSRNGSPDDHVIEINPGAVGATLDQFFADVEATKDEMKNLENIFQSLKSLNEESKTLYDATAVKDLRSRMDADVALALKKAKFIKLKLETLDSSNASSRRVPTCGPGSSSDRTRMSVVHGLKMKLKNSMDAFNGFRNQISAEYRDTVQRRYFTITGEKPDEKTVEILISTGESESLVQKAIEKHGRGRIVETLKEIEERHDAVKEIERRLMELQQVFLDMLVLVQSQGEQLNDIESFVIKANSFVESGTRQVEVAVKTQKSTRKWTCYAIILIILIIFLLLFLLKPWQPNKGPQLTHAAPKTL
ncbi:syntaxin-121-like [Arachis stenosperma]|uniref:syntaxin-121-like n=1 Tax=Arachis stenosperma TaxID=217475 RepID=UPI0025ACDF08|nr:syntaxin-121-like [Arachis stenosperma]